jgi:hypothetical protein
MIKVLFTVLSVVRRTAIAALIIILIVTNVLSVTSAAFGEMLHDIISLSPVKQLLRNSPVTKARRIQAENGEIKKMNRELLEKQGIQTIKVLEARKISKGIAERVANNVAKNVASIPTEAVPYLGAAVVVTVTALDVKDGCDTVRDVNEMMKILEVEPTDVDEREVCGIKVPSSEEILSSIKQDIGGTIYSAKERTKENAQKFYDDLGGTLNEMFNK